MSLQKKPYTLNEVWWGGGSQGKKIRVSKNAYNGFKCILVSCRKHMENDPARPPSPLNMENSICFLKILFESFPYSINFFDPSTFFINWLYLSLGRLISTYKTFCHIFISINLPEPLWWQIWEKEEMWQ